ncbi:MAG: toxin-antitoxin system YwqK family antitoxin [Tepidisphaeraceae bacterium]
MRHENTQCEPGRVERRTVVDRDDIRVIYEDGILKAEIPRGDGVERHYHKNGTLSAEVPVVASETHGLCREWHDNGQLSSERTILNRQIIGVARYWNFIGILTHEMIQVTPHALVLKSFGPRRIRLVYMWQGKIKSKVYWIKKVEASGLHPEVERRLQAWMSERPSDAA